MKGSMLKRAPGSGRTKKKKERVKLCRSPPKILFQDPIGHELPASLQHFRWNVDKVERKLQEKIQEKTLIAGNFVYQQAYRLLECTRGEGIDFPSFREQLRIKFGIILDDAELKVLFDKYDEDRNGTIDLHEFIRRVLPPDYNYGRQWFEISQLESDEKAARLKREARNEFLSGQGLRGIESVSNTGETSAWSMATLMKQIQAKVVQKTPSGEDQYRRAFKMLRTGRDQGIRMQGLQHTLKTRLGINVSNDQMREIFAQCDRDSNGEIDLKEFLQFVDPPAYPRNSKVPGGLWTRGESDDSDVSDAESDYEALEPPSPDIPGWTSRPTSASTVSSRGASVHRPGSSRGSVASQLSSNPGGTAHVVCPPLRIKKERPKTADPRKTRMLQQRRQMVEQQRLEKAGTARQHLQPPFSMSMSDFHSTDLDALSLAAEHVPTRARPPPNAPSPNSSSRRAYHRASISAGSSPSEADTASIGGRSVALGPHGARPRSAGSVRSSRLSYAASSASSGGCSIKGAAYLKRPPTPQSLRQKCLESRGVSAAAAAEAHTKSGQSTRLKKRASVGASSPRDDQQQARGKRMANRGGSGRRHSYSDTSSIYCGSNNQVYSCSPSVLEEDGDGDGHEDDAVERVVPRVVRVHAKQFDARPYTPEGRVLRRSKVVSSGCR